MLFKVLSQLLANFPVLTQNLLQLSLPTLSPTSLPPILALLSLRSQLTSLVSTWTSSRRSIECLEFVRRRWAPELQRNDTSPSTRWRASQVEEILRSICLEPIRNQEADESHATKADSCLLDCGHELHAVSR